MAKRSVLQFKIVLQEIEPTIWRRIQISDLCNFWDLHVAIQDAMGWQDCHLHEFTTSNPTTKRKEQIGIPPDEEEMFNYEVLPGWDLKVLDYMKLKNNHLMRYLYDFGDNWEHLIYFEGAFPKKEKQKYPVCLDGERACPPEDVGSIPGYYNFLEIINDPKHEERESCLEWIGGKYDPEHFEPSKVKFDNPTKRWNQAFKEY